MNHFVSTALDFLGENWDRVIESGASAATLIEVNQSTLKARIKSGRALAMRDEVGRERASIQFTGRHLVWNMVYDRLASFNIYLDGDAGVDNSPKMWAYNGYIYDHIVTGEKQTEAILRIVQRDGKIVDHWFENAAELGQFTGEAALILPVGPMVVRLAASLMAKHSPAKMRVALNTD